MTSVSFILEVVLNLEKHMIQKCMNWLKYCKYSDGDRQIEKLLESKLWVLSSLTCSWIFLEHDIIKGKTHQDFIEDIKDSTAQINEKSLNNIYFEDIPRDIHADNAHEKKKGKKEQKLFFSAACSSAIIYSILYHLYLNGDLFWVYMYDNSCTGVGGQFHYW